MVFSKKKPEQMKKNPKSENKSATKSFFRRKKNDQDDMLPVADLNAGLSRALRSPKVEKKSDKNRADDITLARGALSAIETALYAMDKAREILQQCFEIASSAKNVKEAGARALLADSYDELRLSIDKIAKENDLNDVQLIGPNARDLEIEMTGRARYSISCFPISSSEFTDAPSNEENPPAQIQTPQKKSAHVG